MLVRIANREDPDQTASWRSSLNWVCSGCLGLFGRQLHVVFKILEHLPYTNFDEKLLITLTNLTQYE